MEIDLDAMSEDELRSLNREIVRRLEALSFARHKIALLSFHAGARVSFEADGQTIKGVVVRVNNKTATVVAVDGRNWRVSPGFLRKLERPMRDVSETSNLKKNLFRFDRDRSS